MNPIHFAHRLFGPLVANVLGCLVLAVCHIGHAQLPAPATGTQTRTTKPAALADWTHYLKLAEAGEWDELAKLDFKVFQENLLPRLQDPRYAVDASYLFLCGAGTVNWIYRQDGLAEEHLHTAYRAGFPLVKLAAEMGHWGAMNELAWMLAAGLGTEVDQGAATQWAERAWAAVVKRFGENSPQAARIAEDLALRVYAPTRQLVKAEPLLRRVVANREKSFGKKHPEYARSLINLAGVLLDLGQAGQAEPLYREALAIRRQVLGEKHPDCVESLAGLARALSFASKYAEAEQLHREVLALRKELFGEKSPEYARSLHDLALLLDYDLRRPVQAEPLHRQAQAINKEIFGEKHPAYADSLHGLALTLASMHKYAEAEALHREALKIRKEVLGERHFGYAESLRSLASVLLDMGQYPQAEALFKETLVIRKEVLGERHPAYATSLHDLAQMYMTAGQYSQAEALHRQQLAIQRKATGENTSEYAKSLNNLATLYSRMGQYPQAEQLLQQAQAIKQEILGEKHPDFIAGIGNLAILYQEMGQPAKAEPLYLQALASTKEVQGEKHPAYANDLNNLAAFYYSRGQSTEAERMYRQALAIKKEVLGEKHPAYATGLNNLATLYLSMGQYARAEPLLRQALAIDKEVLGEKHPDYATSLNALARYYGEIGHYVVAERLERQVLAIRKEVLGDKHPSYAASLNNLAVVVGELGQHGQAALLYQESLAIYQETLGKKHPDCAHLMGNLAICYRNLDKSAQAESLLREALVIEREVLGEKHPQYAVTLNALSLGLDFKSKSEEKEALLRQALAIQKEVLGATHRRYATTLNNLAGLLELKEQLVEAEALRRQVLALDKETLGEKHAIYAEDLGHLAHLLFRESGQMSNAVPLLSQAISIMRAQLDDSFGALTEQEQLRLAGQKSIFLENYLTAGVAAGVSPGEQYNELLRWKGAVFLRQAWLRAQQDRPELAGKFEQLRSLQQHLSTQRLKSAPTNDTQRTVWFKRLDELQTQAEAADRDLSHASAEFAQGKAATRLGTKEIQAQLSENVAVLDYFGFQRVGKNAQGKIAETNHLGVFVVRNTGAVKFRDLGPLKPIDEQVERWRNVALRAGSWAEEQKAGLALRQSLWEPVAKELAGVETVLVSGEGPVGRLPFGALPGKESGNYLLEEMGVVVLPVVQQIGEVLAGTGKTRPERLLAVGDVDYGAAPGDGKPALESIQLAVKSGPRAGNWKQFQPLKETGPELENVTTRYASRRGEIVSLRQTDATELRVKQAALQSRWIHVATHGFFADATLARSLGLGARREEGMLSLGKRSESVSLFSGLALTGANREPQFGEDDGIWTTEEVSGTDLRGVELVVLSACETGLGESAKGEGLLGLQRAFQLSGARSVVATLWKVDDEWTKELMTRFYGNLWSETNKVGKLAALRAAQLSVMREARLRSGQARGVQLEGQPTSAAAPREKASPYYWAAFVLSGDWR